MAAAARLNPFAFISDTGLRFGLLIVFTAAAAARRWIAIGLDWADPEQRVGHCLGERVGPAMDAPLATERLDAVQECLSIALPVIAPAVALAWISQTRVGWGGEPVRHEAKQWRLEACWLAT